MTPNLLNTFRSIFTAVSNQNTPYLLENIELSSSRVTDLRENRFTVAEVHISTHHCFRVSVRLR